MSEIPNGHPEGEPIQVPPVPPPHQPPSTTPSSTVSPQTNRNSHISNLSFQIQASQESVYKETTFTYNGKNRSSSNFTGDGDTSHDKLNPTSHKRNGTIKKYKNELKHLLPYREGNERSAIEDYAAKIDGINCFQFIFFTWMSPVVNKIFKGSFTLDDIQGCSPYDSCLQNSRRFKQFWDKECRKSGLHNASLEWTMFKFIRTRFLVSSFFYLICLTTGYLSSTYFVKKLLEEIETSLTILPPESLNITSHNVTSFMGHPTALALQWTAALCICELLRAISYSIMFGIIIRTGVRAVNALNGTLYEKILSKRTCNTDQRSSLLQPTNLFANDLGKVFQMIYMLPLVIGSPIIILVTIVYTVHLIGHSALVGMILFVLIFGLQFYITKKQARIRDKLMAQADNRIAMVTQLMKDIRTIKFNAWESPFQKEILYCRDIESSLIVKYQYLQCFSTSLALLTPMMITIINILMHTFLGQDLSVSTAFSLVMLNYIAAHGIRSLPNYLREIVNGRIALERIERFLRLDDQLPYLIYEVQNPAQNSVEIIDASFSWATTPELEVMNRNSYSFLLSNINLNVPKRAHLCLYGPVGSGKSALLMSILGQTQCFKGEVRLASEKLSYVAQTPWLQNCSIRDNILFGSPFDRKRYYETLIKCQLAQDISQLSDGEHTIVGENGRQLSGGQKQRIQLARAVYANSDIYLFDDLFSALDSRVVRTIFQNVLNDLLKSKTVIFVTRHLHLLGDQTLVAMLQDGQIVKLDEHGKLVESDPSYKEAVDRSKLIGVELKPEVKPIESVDGEEPVPEEPVRTSLEIAQSEEEEEIPDGSDDDDDDDFDTSQENLLFSKNSTLEGAQKSQRIIPGAQVSSTSYTSLISLLEKCDQNNNADQDDFPDDDPSDLETRLFRKYSKKYKKKFPSKNSSKKPDSGKSLQKQKAISGATYNDYIRSSGGWWIFALMVTIFGMQTVTSTFASWWLSYWLNQGDGGGSKNTTSESTNSGSILSNPELPYYQSVYLFLFFIVIFTSLLMGCFFARIIVRAANSLHSRILTKLLHSPLAFFDTIQLGRILNLFSHNIDELDNQLPIALDGFIQRFLLVIGTFLLIISTLYWFSIPFALFCILFVLIYRLYRTATYWLKQADLRLRSPIYSFIQSSMDGLSTLKAFKADQRFSSDFFALCDRHQAANWLALCNVRWLSIRIDILCIMANVLVCVLVLVNLEKVGSAYAGLVITQSMQLSGLLQLVVRLALDLETRLVSVERIQAYIRLLRTERDTILQLEKEGQLDPNSEWPSSGRISFREVSLRYRAGLPLALQGVTFDITAGDKVAIVGRTGAGKSSITYALFRLVEVCAGAVYIDGVDIRGVPLHKLRSRITIIPQDPVLFQGSVRKNLDPMGRTPEVELLRVLEQVHLKAKIESLRNGLDETITVGGGSSGSSSDQQFSTGEKQLLCLARALLRNSQIIILDEATAAVDDQTEKEIWNIIRTVFGRCTVMLIAHRLQTVLNCDQVIVIRKGKVVEFGDPIALRDDQRSLFSRMIQSTNKTN